MSSDRTISTLTEQQPAPCVPSKSIKRSIQATVNQGGQTRSVINSRQAKLSALRWYLPNANITRMSRMLRTQIKAAMHVSAMKDSHRGMTAAAVLAPIIIHLHSHLPHNLDVPAAAVPCHLTDLTGLEQTAAKADGAGGTPAPPWSQKKPSSEQLTPTSGNVQGPSVQPAAAAAAAEV